MPPDFDLVCLSHLRWDFVYQRPQHLMSRFARERRVFYMEPPRFGRVRLELQSRRNGVCLAIPRIPKNMWKERNAILRELLDELLERHEVRRSLLWYYTPMAVDVARHLNPVGVVYDCMDELSAFKEAPRVLRRREAELFQLADLVFTGGQSLYEAKRSQHPYVYAFPSSVDAAHFARARERQEEPVDQAPIRSPRVGFYGVIDERMDLELLRGIAEARPDWQLVMIGPVAKVKRSRLPVQENIHYLGGKSYEELPAYLSGWDVAILPFVRNKSTRFVSPTKIPEYLAAGQPVVSTSIHDVVRPYGEQGMVRIADTVEEFVAAIEAALSENRASRLPRVDAFLEKMSWDSTWARMNDLIETRIGTIATPEETPVKELVHV